jgi:hypothetical protein
MYFRGTTMYSYRDNFPIARLYDAATGERVVLFTTLTYSQTTETHKGAVRGAARAAGLRIIPCAYVTGFDMASNEGDFKKVMVMWQRKHAAARKPELYTGKIIEQAYWAREYCEVMGQPTPVWATLTEHIEAGAPLTHLIEHF